VICCNRDRIMMHSNFMYVLRWSDKDMAHSTRRNCGIPAVWLYSWVVWTHKAAWSLSVASDCRQYTAQCRQRLKGKYTVWVKKKVSPLRFSDIFSKTVGNFLTIFTHLLYVPIYASLQIFIQLSLTVTKLCHIKCDHPANFYILLEL